MSIPFTLIALVVLGYLEQSMAAGIYLGIVALCIFLWLAVVIVKAVNE